VGDKSWEDMAREVLVEGNPAKVQSAALGWKELIKNLNQVKESLETNVKDLGKTWKGPAYEAFKTHIEGIAKKIDGIVDDIDKPGRGKVSIVTTLETAAKQLEDAQNKMPIPAACVGDIMAARNGEITIGVGFFEAKVTADLMGSWPVEQIGKLTDWVTGWFSDQEGEARKVYNEVNNNYKQRVMEAPGNVSPIGQTDVRPEVPNLDDGGGGGPSGKVPSIGDTPKPGDIDTGKPPTSLRQVPDLDKPKFDPRTHPDLTPDYPGTDSDGRGTGLAGATPPSTTNFNPGGGLGTGGGLGGGSGTGLSGGSLPGGGLGKPVSPGLPPMLGGGMAGAGGRGASGGRLGTGGARPGIAGAMAPGAAGGRGGTGGRAAAAGRPGAAAMAGRGALAGAGHGGAGYGEEELPRNTWLEEDEDVWGAGGDGAPGVLR
jgi:hypothetical protein